MAILVGDPIVSMRALGPDPCGVLPSPTGVTLGGVASGGTLAPGTYYVVVTYLTPWGESVPSPEVFITLVSGITGLLVRIASFVPGPTAMRVYFGLAAGSEAQYQQFDVSSFVPGTTVTVTVTGYGSPSLPPQKSSAYLPDSDGTYVSAAIAYRWLNSALRKMAVTLGGIRDVSGVAWPSQAAWQVLNNRWTEIENIWWSGWYQQIGRQEYTWMQSPITSVPGYATHWSNAGRDMIGLWPQPGTGPGTSTLTTAMGLTDTTISVAAVGGFTMPGMFQIDQEFILASAPNGAGPFQMVGVIRGVGGSIAATHLSGAPITQMIAMFSGARLAPEFSPGSSYTALQLPAGWSVPLDRYMLARFREKEQLLQESQALDQEYMVSLENLRTSKDAVPKDRAVGDGRVYNSFLGYQRSGALPFGILVN
jgi:hypothetical protein